MSKLYTTFIILIMIWITLYIFKMLSKIFFKKQNIANKFLQSTIKISIILIGIYIIFSQWGNTKNITEQIFKNGTLLIAIATFAAQRTLGNVISGIMLSASHPINIGQKIKITNNGQLIAEGIVKDMTIRHVIIETYDGQSCIIPNSIIDSAVIQNTNYNDGVGNYMKFEVGYDTDIPKAKQLILNALVYEHAKLKPGTEIQVSKLTPNGIELKFTVWTETLNENFLICSRLRERIVKIFRDNGITIPYNTITIDK